MLPLFFILAVAATSCRRGEPPSVPFGKLENKSGVFCLDGNPFTGMATDKHPNAQLRAKYPFDEGRMHGTAREWWDNAQPSTETEYDHGQRHGEARQWNREGQLLREQIWSHDKVLSDKTYEPDVGRGKK